MDEIKVEKYRKEPGFEGFQIVVPEKYENTDQVKILKYNKIPGLMEVEGNGLEEKSCYTYHPFGGISVEEMYREVPIQKAEIEQMTEQLLRVISEAKNYMLNPCRFLLKPECIYVNRSRYQFCYLPGTKELFYETFHELTELFVRRLDYKDTEGVFLAHTLHRETMCKEYDLEQILSVYYREKEERKKEEEEKKKKRDKELFEEYVIENQSLSLREEKRYGPIKDVIERIKTGYWGDWDDLIREINIKNDRQ